MSDKRGGPHKPRKPRQPKSSSFIPPPGPKRKRTMTRDGRPVKSNDAGQPVYDRTPGKELG